MPKCDINFLSKRTFLTKFNSTVIGRIYPIALRMTQPTSL